MVANVPSNCYQDLLVLSGLYLYVIHIDLRNWIVLSDNHHLIVLSHGWLMPKMDATSGDILWR